MTYTVKVYGTPPARAKALLLLAISDAQRRYRSGSAPHTALVDQTFVDEKNVDIVTPIVAHTLDFTPVTAADVPGAVIKANAYIKALNAHLADGDFAHPGGADASTTAVTPTVVDASNLQTAVGNAKTAVNAHLILKQPHYMLPSSNPTATVAISSDNTAIDSLNEQLILFERHINGAAVLPEDVGT